MLGGELGAVLPISLIAVILLGIMRCGNVYSRNASKLTDSKGKLGSGAERVKDIYLYARCRQNFSRNPCKKLGVVSRIVRDNNAVVCSVFLYDEVGKSLSSLSNGIYVHRVHTDLHSAAETRSTEGKA